jgi:hypothetical protein
MLCLSSLLRLQEQNIQTTDTWTHVPLSPERQEAPYRCELDAKALQRLDRLSKPHKYNHSLRIQLHSFNVVFTRTLT